MTYSSQGIIRTSDGKETAFDLTMNLSRSFASQETFSLQLGAAKVDPLVINLDVPSAGLSGLKIRFDLDSDGNNWIDEADAVFQRLPVWTKDEFGNDHLLAIAEAGVGAIYLGHIDTGFIYKDSSNASLAELAKTGIFLRESGAASTIQHIDFFV